MNQSIRFKLLPLVTRSLLIAACVAPAMGHAEDIDLFLKPSAERVRANVLLVLDNAANNSSTITLLDGTRGDKLTMIREVLNVLTNPLDSPHFPDCTVTPATRNDDGEILTEATRVPKGCTTRAEADTLISSINLGLMLLNPSTASESGGYVHYHVRPMDVAANRADLWDSVSPEIPKSNNAPYAKLMHEAYRYFSGGAFYAGFSGGPDDPDAKIVNGVGVDYYNSPVNAQCQSNYLIFLGNGAPDSNEETDTAELLEEELNGKLTTDPIELTPNNLESSWFDEYARTLKKKDVSSVAGTQNITTYTIAIQDPDANNFDTNTNKSSRALLEKAAQLGGGQYALGSDGAAVLKALFDSMRQMQPEDSVFAAVTLPVSVNVRGTFLNQVYMGQFRPDENAKPRWPGNLKQYQIVLEDGYPVLADRNEEAVEDTDKGFLLADKTSFWTATSSDWSFIPSINASDAPDGSVVEKGGAGQKMRNDFNTAAKRANRKIYTCNGRCVSGNDLSLINFSTDNANPNGPSIGNLKVVDAAERTALIEWVRGADNKDDEDGDGDLTDNRAYIHGDLLHSRPAVINYNRESGNNDVMVYYGANDGIFHAVKGGQGDADGVEKWGMVFPEFFGRLKSLRDNDAVISVSSPKPYFADGSVSVYQNDLNDNKKIDSGDKAYLYIGMRRGGEFAHALDVTDPDIPKYLWRISPDISVQGQKVFRNLGQTWSTLRPATIKALTSGPVVIMGGGYDNASEDKVPAIANTRGKGIYVINGETGALISHIVSDAMGSIPADLTVLDRDGDGKADRIYAPDTKGNVWRADIDDADPANWTLHHIAALGGTGGDGRKFLNKIDVVYGSTFDALLVGSGDREHPDNMSITDRFYMLMDTNIGINAGGKFCGPAEMPVTCTHEHLADVTLLNPYQNATLPTEKKGWYLTFEAGEKVVNSPVTVFGTVIFGTNTPQDDTDPGVCGNLGKAKLYQIGFKTGNAVNDLNGDGTIDVNDRSEELAGGGFLPSGVYSPVTINGERIEVVCVGTRCFKPEGGKYGPTRHRTYWYRKQ